MVTACFCMQRFYIKRPFAKPEIDIRNLFILIYGGSIKETTMAQPKLTIDSAPRRPKDVERPIFDRAANDIEDADDHMFDEMRNDGELSEDQTLNEGSSAMSDQPSNGPKNRFNGKFNE